jgi:multidrug resistance protein, MATE family
VSHKQFSTGVTQSLRNCNTSLPSRGCMQRRLLSDLKSAASDQNGADIIKFQTSLASDPNIEIALASNPVVARKNPWPCNDELDKRILGIAGPALLNLAIIPLVGVIDTFWVGRMREALALAGQSAANQVFSSASLIISFLPAVVTPLIAKAAASGDKDLLRKYVSEAIFLGTIMGLFGMGLLTIFTDQALSSVLLPGSSQLVYAKPYLFVRALTFLPSLLSTVGFAVFRGTLDVITPLKISAISNLVNLILDPIFMFNLGLGITGAAAATCVSELVSLVLFTRALVKANIIKLQSVFRVPSFSSIKPLLLGGLSIQLRSAALNLAILRVVRRAQTLDNTGTLAAAHSITIQLWQLGGIFLFAMSIVANIIVPAELAKGQRENDPNALAKAKFVADRMMLWGVVLGGALAAFQLLSLPLLKVFSPLKEVQEAAKWPSIIGAMLQMMNGVVFIGEGVQQGNQYFTSLAVATAIATVGMLTSLELFGHSLPGVWLCFATFNGIRLLGVLRHHFFDGPFSAKNMKLDRLRREEAEKTAALAI